MESQKPISDASEQKDITKNLPSTTTSQYIKAQNKSNGGNKFKSSKIRSRSIPVLIPVEQNGDEHEKTKSNNSNVVLRSRSLHTLENLKNSDVISENGVYSKSTEEIAHRNRYSEPIEMNYLKLYKSDSSSTLKTEQIKANLQLNSTVNKIDEMKKRNMLLNTSTNQINLLTNINSDSRFKGKSNENMNNNDELFDPSLVFYSSYRCYYYDSSRSIRKGKLLLSANELIFKCAGMPFVKAHLKYQHIITTTILENYETVNQNILCIEYKTPKQTSSFKYYFYNFIIPIKLVKMNIKHLIKKSNKKILNENSNENQQQEQLQQEQHNKKSIKSRVKSIVVKTLRRVHSDSYDVTNKKSNVSKTTSNDSSVFLVSKSSKTETKPSTSQLENSNGNSVKNKNDSCTNSKSSSSSSEAAVSNLKSKNKSNSSLQLTTNDASTSKTALNNSTQSHKNGASTSTTPQQTEQQPTQTQQSQQTFQVQSAKSSAKRSNSTYKTIVHIAQHELTTIKKTTGVTIFLFLFMVFFIMINFFKLSQLEYEIGTYNT